MSFVKVWIHAVWGTKNHRPLLTKNLRDLLTDHIRQNAKAKEICIDRLNGSTDHLHCLFALNADMSVAKVLQLLKGESAHWVNREEEASSKFEWANEYYAASVSESALNSVRAYIDNQEEHHRTKPFSEEVDGFLKEYHLLRQG